MNIACHPKIIFVDAPTAFGKDYFIDKFTDKLKEKHPELRIKNIRATDITFNKNTKSEDRKYTIYKTEEEKIQDIYLGHINLLCYLNELINSTTNEADVVIVNRSFISFLNYNIYPQIEGVQSSNLINKVSDYITTYCRLYSNLFYNTPSLFIRLTLHGSTEDIFNTVINRIKSRDDGKEVNVNWVKYIVTRYNVTDIRLETLFGMREVITSDHHNFILNKYF